MKLKLCGIRSSEDIEYMNEFRPDYIGYVFAPSPRRITPKHARKLNKKLAIGIRSAGVFVNEPVDELIDAVKISGVDVIQLHGDETREYISELRKLTDKKIWKAVRVRDSSDIVRADMFGADALVLDSYSRSRYGGTGKTSDWDVISNIRISTPFFMAGGIDTSNLSNCVSEIDPYGIDISGGIETDGHKDHEKIKQIMKIINPYRFDS
ncbi:MAG: phosphoribosylanthranilate isomerase [Oscillospiraceae bacterium]|nr:phosphoribosylanthranilate isomerase [Oscillospiraceae bacterium]